MADHTQSFDKTVSAQVLLQAFHKTRGGIG